MLHAIGNGAVCTVNALLPQQYAGSGGVNFGRPSRIANLRAVHLLDGATILLVPAEKLRERFETIGAIDNQVIKWRALWRAGCADGRHAGPQGRVAERCFVE